MMFSTYIEERSSSVEGEKAQVKGRERREGRAIFFLGEVTHSPEVILFSLFPVHFDLFSRLWIS